MDNNKTANLEYVDNLQKKILSLRADCKRKDKLLKRVSEGVVNVGNYDIRRDIKHELKEK